LIGIIVSGIYSFLSTAQAAPWVDVACNGTTSFALQKNGDLYGAGLVTGLGVRKQLISFSGPLNYAQFKRVLTGVVAVESNGGTSIVLKKDGTVWTTGLNLNGELGDKNFNVGRGKWRKTLSSAKAIAVSPNASYALKRDGSLWVTGSSIMGSGLLKVNPSWTKALDNVSKVWLNGIYPVVKKTDGSLWRVVTGVNGLQWEQVPISGNYLVVAGNQMFVLDNSNNLRRYDKLNYMPMLYSKRVNEISQPEDNLVAEHVTKIAYGNGDMYFTPDAIDLFASFAPAITLAILDDNKSLMVPRKPNYSRFLDEIEWDALIENVKDFCVGETHALVLKYDSSIWATGLNNEGQYGNGTMVGTNRREIWTLVAKSKK